MTPTEYIKEVLVTESVDAGAIRARLHAETDLRFLHHAMGMSTEAGELLDVAKKHAFYGRMIDVVNVVEELGDMLWYIGGMISVLNDCGVAVTFESVMDANIAKLRKRYSDVFSSEEANNRDIAAERCVLEGGEE